MMFWTSWIVLFLLMTTATLAWVPSAFQNRHHSHIHIQQHPIHSRTALSSWQNEPNSQLQNGPANSNNSNNNDNDNENYQSFVDRNRRKLWLQTASRFASIGLGAAALVAYTRPVWAGAPRSRSEGYSVQKSEDEWQKQLSAIQYNILRQGGTERPGYSILETEKRPGIFRCAGCGTDLFQTADKFNSGTGWPSFASGLPGVEIDPTVDPVTASLAGAELRCKTCGGHLGDVFNDGFLFQGTVAAKTGKRYCIDGAALVFYPDDGGTSLSGDMPKPPKEPSWMSGPKITPRDRQDV